MISFMIDPTGAFDDSKYSKLALESAENFQKAKPFQHIYFNNFLDIDLAKELRMEFPDYNDDISWHVRNTENIKKTHKTAISSFTLYLYSNAGKSHKRFSTGKARFF